MTYNKEQYEFINLLKTDLRDINHEIIGDYFYEWKVENWSKISNEECVYSPEFSAFGYKWKLELYPNGVDDYYKGNITLYLYRDNKNDDCCVHITVNRVFFVRNYYDTNCYKSGTLPIEYLSKSIPSSGIPDLINKSQLYAKNGYSNKSIIENDKLVFGVYFVIYKTEREGQFKREITCYVDDEGKTAKNKGFYEWKVSGWNKNKKYSTSPKSSPVFNIADHRWTLDVYKYGDGYDNKDYVSIFLKCLDPEKPKGGFWVNGVLFIRNSEDDTDCFIFDVLEFRKFDKDNVDWGFSKLIKKKDIFIKSKGSNKSLIENDSCIVGAYFHVYDKEREKQKIDEQPSSSKPQENQNQLPEYTPFPSSSSPYQNTSYPPAPYSSFPNPPYPYPNPQYSSPPAYYPPSNVNQDQGLNNVSAPQYSPYANPPYANPPYANPPYANPPYANPPYANPPYANPPYPNPPYPYSPYQTPYQAQQPYQPFVPPYNYPTNTENPDQNTNK